MMYYKKSDDLKQIRKRIRRFSLQHKIFRISFFIIAAIGLIHAALIYIGVMEIGHITIILSCSLLVAFVPAFGFRGNSETQNIIRDLKRREQELIFQEQLKTKRNGPSI